MFKRFGLTTLILGSVLALVPASGFAGDRDDFYRGDNAYGYSRNEYVNRDNHEYREHGRRELRERSDNQRWDRGRYNDRYSSGRYRNSQCRNRDWNGSRY